ncbi:hypothetical protein ABZ512_24160 [Nocardiopsis dassonvillei]|uniref:hypothetical protein n=1 Tax=Nocardiopsis dassonvillei TaxID=2014 RepID=UPI0034110FB8
MPVYRPMRERLADQHLTDKLLQALAHTGPGGLITFSTYSGGYHLIGAEWLLATDRETIVYGYGDLLHDLEWACMLPSGRAWPAVVAAADHIAHACLEWEPWEPARPRRRTALDWLRTGMRRNGFALLRRPLYTDTGELRRLDDTYLDTVHPDVTVTVATPYPDAAEEESATFTWFTHQGRFITSWHTSARDQRHLPGQIRDRITAHLTAQA